MFNVQKKHKEVLIMCSNMCTSTRYLDIWLNISLCLGVYVLLSCQVVCQVLSAIFIVPFLL